MGAMLSSRNSPCVVALCCDRGCAARLREAFGASLEAVQTAAELQAAVKRRAVSLLIVQPWDRDHRAIAPVVHQIHALQPAIPIAAYVDRSAESLRQLVELVKAGASVPVIRDVDDGHSSLRALPRDTVVQEAVKAAHDACREMIPLRIEPMVGYCLDHLFAPGDANSIAAAAGVQRRAASRRLQSSGIPGVRAVRGRCKVLVAIAVIVRRPYTPEQVALRLGYGSAANLSTALRRHAHATVLDIARLPDLAFWVRRLFGSDRSADVFPHDSRIEPRSDPAMEVAAPAAVANS